MRKQTLLNDWADENSFSSGSPHLMTPDSEIIPIIFTHLTSSKLSHNSVVNSQRAFCNKWRESLQNARAAICFNFIALVKQKEWKRKLLVWMNSKLLFSLRSNECRSSVWTVNKINRLRNQSTHSWEIKGTKHLFSEATARWSNYLLSLTALFFPVLVSLLCWFGFSFGLLSSITPATIIFPLKISFIRLPFDESRHDRLFPSRFTFFFGSEVESDT